MRNLLKLAILFALAMGCGALTVEGQVCTTGVASGTWQPDTMPTAMTTGGASIQSLYAAKDCYVYVAMSANGTWRAKASDLRISPTTAANWIQIDSGFPADPLHGGTAYPISWTEDATGNVFAGIGEVALGGSCSYCVVGKWNGTTWTFSSIPTGLRSSIASLSFDGTGNLYLVDKSADFYKSTNGGVSFGSAIVTDAYTAFGQASGAVFEMKIINNIIYWGGEGAYMSSPLSLASGTVLHGGGYALNTQAIASDGTPSTAPTYILAVSRRDVNGYSLSRYNVGTATWTDLEAAAGFPQYYAITQHSLVNGLSNEYLGSGNTVGVVRSTDSGNTWATFNAGLPANEISFAKRMAVSPFDGSRYLTTSTASGGSLELWSYPMTSAAGGPITITANKPAYNFQVLLGSTRQINAIITGGTGNKVNWSVLSTTGSATATFTNPTNTAAASISGALPTIQVNIGSTAGVTPSCTITGPAPPSGIGSYGISSNATVTVQAQSVDDVTKTTTFLFNICGNTTTVIVAPFYMQAYPAQLTPLQSWVTGNTNENVTWSILTQPVSGNGVLADTGNRDTQFSATVSGEYTLKATSAADATKTATAIIYVSALALPAYAATPNNTEPRPCDVDATAFPTDYEVGAGKTYASPILAPNFATWTAGTIMRIWNTGTAGAPSVYTNYFQVQQNGTPTRPTWICGVPIANGELPVMDAANATSQTGVRPSLGGVAGEGIMTASPAASTAGYWQGGNLGPQYLGITGIHFRNANPSSTYTQPGGVSGTCPNGTTGTTCAWDTAAACIQLRGGANIAVWGNELDTCRNGFASYENGNNSGWAVVSQNVYVRGNYIHGSGSPSGYTEHQAYFQSFYGVFEGNRLDNYNASAQGSNVKWRGIEGFLRYNSLASGPLRDFDLVEVQDASAYLTFEPPVGSGAGVEDSYLGFPGATNCNTALWCGGISAGGDTAGANIITGYQESLQKDYVYGNMIFGTSSQYQNHYNEDHDASLAARGGTLYFYSNTLDNAQVVFDTGNANGYNIFLTSNIDARNNLLWNRVTVGASANQTEFGRYASVIGSWKTNLMKASTFSITAPILGGNFNAGTSNGWEATCDNGICPWLLTVPIDVHQYGLTNPNFLTTASQPYDPTTFIPSGAAVGAATILTGLPATSPVRSYYDQPSSSLKPRSLGNLDIGAVPSGGTPTVVSPTFTPGAGTYGVSQNIAMTSTTVGASLVYTNDGTLPTVTANTCTITHGKGYFGPVIVSVNQTLNALACLSTYNASPVASAAYTISRAAASPTFTPAAGSYPSTRNVALASSTPGAQLCSTANGTNPSATNGTCTNGLAYYPNYTPFLNSQNAGGWTAIGGTVCCGGSNTGSAAFSIGNATPSLSGASYKQTSSGAGFNTLGYLKPGCPTGGCAAMTGDVRDFYVYIPAATNQLQALELDSVDLYDGTLRYFPTVQCDSVSMHWRLWNNTWVDSGIGCAGFLTTTDTWRHIQKRDSFNQTAHTYTFLDLLVDDVYVYQNLGTTYNATPSPTAPDIPTLVIEQQIDNNASVAANSIYVDNDNTFTSSTPTPIVVSSSQTLKALASSATFASSPVASAAYVISTTAALPSFSPAAGGYTAALSVTISTTSPSAILCYNFTGAAIVIGGASSCPPGSTLYSSPVAVPISETLYAVAGGTGYADSGLASAAYVLTATPPTPSPGAGTYAGTQSIALTAPGGQSIVYTVDNTTPTVTANTCTATNGIAYTVAISVASSQTIKAISCQTGWTASGLLTAAYVINGAAATPTFFPVAGSYAGSTLVTMTSATSGFSICSTSDGTTPVVSGGVCTNGILGNTVNVTVSATIKAIAFAPTYLNSAVGSAAYVITAAAPARQCVLIYKGNAVKFR